MAPAPRSDRPSPDLLGGVHEAAVESFDSASGLGELRLIGQPDTLVRFHCMVIADGSREVAVGAPVAARLGIAPDGGVEARSVIKLSC
ncbi:MAG: hypothetical protein M0000_07575 [Actinomycetota bacterium]|nr:hypothetical protein [Actinomycetota bacterium]MDA8208282.1 hypothetical protein [Actinomycetota bacterium]